MPIHGFPNFVCELDDASGTLTDVSATVRAFSGFPRNRQVEEVTGANEGDDRHVDVGITKKGQITIGCPYDDRSDGLVDITEDAEGDTRTLRVDWSGGGSNRQTVECIIVSADINPSVDQLTQYQVVLQPTGAMTRT